MKKFIFLLLLNLQFVIPQTGKKYTDEDRSPYDSYFEQAGHEFGVPSDVLRGISFAETRWTHMTWDQGDTASSCTGIPRVYGVMGLWDNEYFGHSLRLAAALIGKSIQEVKESPLQNIRGAAALLKKYYSELPKPDFADDESIESWQNAIAKFSGFPQQEISQQRGLEVYTALANGYNDFGIKIHKREINLEPLQRAVRQFENAAVERRRKTARPEKTTNQPDYPSAKWNPAYAGNFGTDLIAQKFVVIHDVEGSYLGCISWFQNPSAQVSAHFVLNSNPFGVNSTTHAPNGSSDAPVGEVTQMVEEKYRAWHVGCWNSYMIGIEHEGYYNVSGWYTQECYQSSSNLVSYLCKKYNIPRDRYHIIGHQEWQNAAWKNWVAVTGLGFDPTCNTHVDPGANWDWKSFMSLITVNDTITPSLESVSVIPGDSAFKTYRSISVRFNTPMDINSTVAAFSIVPAVAGNLKWKYDNTGFTFIPSSGFQFNTVYTLTLDSSAKSVGMKRSVGGVPYSITFKTNDVDTVGPVVVRHYPKDNDGNVPLKPFIILRMSDSVQTATLGPALKLYDPENKTVSLTGAKNESINDSALISFSPTLKPNTTYTLKLLPGVKDAYGNLSTDSVVITFTTENESFVLNGNFIDQFENGVTEWKSPSQSSFIRYADTAATKFLATAGKKYAGTMAGTLLYQFTEESLGVVPIEPVQPILLDGKSSLGFWAFGDTSYNRLQVLCMPDSQRIDIGKINWLGWKYLSFDIHALTGSSKSLAALLLTEEYTGARNGQIFIDDIQTDAVVSAVTASSGMVPESIVLGQNFPNPFNPATTITFTLNKDAMVTLKVYDLLGREISTIIRGKTAKGDHAVVFDASELPSGIYFYTLTGDHFSTTRKMVLMK
jgi:N-acetyl-anhydromuramyl-L-alanine amidase AmpD